MKETENKPARQSLTLQASAGGKEYEMSYLLTPEIPEDKTGSEVEELKKILVENGGGIIQADPLEKRRLAYPVKKQTYAYFGIIYFNNKEKLDKIKKAVMSNEKILRFLILTHSTRSGLIPIKPAPVIAQQKPAESSETPASAPSFDQKLESILNR